MGYTLSRDEQETIILIYPTEEYADIGTSDPIYIRRLNTLCEKYPDVYRMTNENQYGEKSYTAPKKMITFKNPPSEAQIAASRKAIERIHANKA